MSEPFLAEIKLVSFNFPPKGWALCNGQLLPINQNQALFSLLGTTYGGNGQTTFALPDLRGRYPIGVGQGPGLSNYDLGQVGGTENTTLTNANLPAAPPITIKANTDSTSSKPANNFPASLSQGNGYNPATDGTSLNAGAVTGGLAGGSSSPFDNHPPYLGLNYCIALEGIFPSRN